MPELPEVETVARQLRPKLKERVVRQIHVFDPLLGGFGGGVLVGRAITDVQRVGKEIAIYFGTKTHDPALSVHLRMTGRLIWNPDSTTSALKHLRACFELDQGVLQFFDVRRFGTLKVMPASQLRAPGLDPMSRAFTHRALANLLKDSRQEIKGWLLRQDRLVGVGNIYASEALFAAGIDPRRAGNSLSPEEIGRLHAQLLRILKLAIKNAGTTFSDYRDSAGKKGAFQNMLMVYGRDGDPCRNCRSPVKRLIQNGRSTFWCPKCQGG